MFDLNAIKSESTKSYQKGNCSFGDSVVIRNIRSKDLSLVSALQLAGHMTLSQLYNLFRAWLVSLQNGPGEGLVWTRSLPRSISSNVKKFCEMFKRIQDFSTLFKINPRISGRIFFIEEEWSLSCLPFF